MSKVTSEMQENKFNDNVGNNKIQILPKSVIHYGEIVRNYIYSTLEPEELRKSDPLMLDRYCITEKINKFYRQNKFLHEHFQNNLINSHKLL